MNKLWLIRPAKYKEGDFEYGDWDPWYDKCFGFVVCAENEPIARGLAAEEHGNEGKDVWLDDRTICTELTTRGGQTGIVMRDFAAA